MVTNVYSQDEINQIANQRKEVIAATVKVIEDLLQKAKRQRSAVITEMNELRAQLKGSVQDMLLDKKDEGLLNTYREKLKRYRNSASMKQYRIEINAAVKEEEEINTFLQQLRREDIGDMKVLRDETQNLETEIKAIEDLLRLVEQHKTRVFTRADMQKLQQDYSEVLATLRRDISDLHLDERMQSVKADLERKIESFSQKVERLVVAIDQSASKPQQPRLPGF